jgi:hypothetical protein
MKMKFRLLALGLAFTAAYAVAANPVAKQVSYEVTLSVDGKVTNSMKTTTANGETAALASTSSRAYPSCTSATDCETKEVTTGLKVSLTPTVAEDGTILTTGDVDLSKLDRMDSVQENGFVKQHPVTTEMKNHSQFSVKSGQTLVMPFEVKDSKYKLTIKATRV